MQIDEWTKVHIEKIRTGEFDTLFKFLVGTLISEPAAHAPKPDVDWQAVVCSQDDHVYVHTEDERILKLFLDFYALVTELRQMGMLLTVRRNQTCYIEGFKSWAGVPASIRKSFEEIDFLLQQTTRDTTFTNIVPEWKQEQWIPTPSLHAFVTSNFRTEEEVRADNERSRREGLDREARDERTRLIKDSRKSQWITVLVSAASISIGVYNSCNPSDRNVKIVNPYPVPMKVILVDSACDSGKSPRQLSSTIHLAKSDTLKHSR